MAVDLVYFAWVRERIGLDGETVTVPDSVGTVADLVAWLARRGGGYAAAFDDPERLRAAIDQTFVAMDADIGDAREIALFPPVTGG